MLGSDSIGSLFRTPEGCRRSRWLRSKFLGRRVEISSNDPPRSLHRSRIVEDRRRFGGGLRGCPRPSAGPPCGPPPRKCEAVADDYLRAAQAYMLISMPTGTSTIFGVFQAILDILSHRTC